MRNNRTALFAVIESGDAGSEITAKLGEPNGRYYTVYNTFSWTSREYVTLEAKVASNGSARRVYLCDKNGFQSDMTLAFYPLTGEKASYSGMAAVYRAILLEKGMQQEGGAGPVSSCRRWEPPTIPRPCWASAIGRMRNLPPTGKTWRWFAIFRSGVWRIFT